MKIKGIDGCQEMESRRKPPNGRWSNVTNCLDSVIFFSGFPGRSAGKESTCSTGDLGSIPGTRRSPGNGNGYPLQYSGLENSMDRGAWWATQSVGLQRAWHDWVTFTFCCFCPWCHCCDCRYRFYLFVVIVNMGVAKNEFWKPDLQYQPNWGSPQLHLSPPSSKWRTAAPVWIQSQVEKEDKYSLSFSAFAPEVFS